MILTSKVNPLSNIAKPLTFFLMLGVFSNASANPANPANSPKAPKPVQVIAYEATLQSQPQTIEVLGHLKAKQSISLSVNVADTIRTLNFKSGQQVKKGDLLFELNNAEELAGLQQAIALEEESLSHFKRVKQAVNSSAVTQVLVDEKQRELLIAKAKRKQIEAQLADRKIKAPFSGQLGFSPYAVGSRVSPGDTIVSLDDVSQMKLDLFVPSKYLNEIKIGQAVLITTSAFKNKNFEGKVIAISPRLHPQTRLLQIQAMIPNNQNLLKTNMMVQASIQLSDQQQLRIPNSAVLMLGDKEFVFRLSPNETGTYQAEKVLVETGEIGFSKTEILSGLNPKDIVASQGVMRVRANAPVIIKAMQNNQLQADLLLPNASKKQGQ